jgi:hypothetical protein
MSSQRLLHVSAYQRHHQGAHIILTSYLYVSVTKSNAPTCFGVPTPSSGSSYDPHKLLILYVGVHYKKNNGVSSKLAPVSIVTLWIHFGPCSTTVHCFQQQFGRVPQQFIASNSIWTVFHNSPLLPTALGPVFHNSPLLPTAFGPCSTTVHCFQQHLGRVPQQFIASNSTWAVFHNSPQLPTALGPCSTTAHCFQQQLAITHL